MCQLHEKHREQSQLHPPASPASPQMCSPGHPASAGAGQDGTHGPQPASSSPEPVSELGCVWAPLTGNLHSPMLIAGAVLLL